MRATQACGLALLLAVYQCVARGWRAVQASSCTCLCACMHKCVTSSATSPVPAAVAAVPAAAEKLHCLDLSPVWKLLPQSALDCLEVWRVAAQSRAAAAATAAATACVPAGVGVGAVHCGGINAASKPAAGEVEPVRAAAEAAETGPAAQVSVGNAAVQLASQLDSRDSSQQAGPAAPAADITTTAATKQEPHRSSSAVSSSSISARRDAAPWASAFASWQQRQQLRQQQLVAALRRCVGAPAAAAASLKHTANNRHTHAPSAQQHARPGPTAGVSKAVAQLRRETHRQGGGSGSGGRGGSGRLAGSLRGMGLADLLQDSCSDLAAAAAATAAAAVAAVLPVVPHAGVMAGRRQPVLAAATAVMHPPQQTGLQQHASSVLAPVAATQRQGVKKSTRPPPKQQSARRLVAAAQQQQRAARLARYQEAFRAWSLEDMLQEVRSRWQDGCCLCGAVAECVNPFFLVSLHVPDTVVVQQIPHAANLCSETRIAAVFGVLKCAGV